MASTLPRDSESLLIIFYRNPEPGKVKTRLASTLGETKALSVYLYLSAHTKTITQNLKADKVVFYSDYIQDDDPWNPSIYQKQIQSGGDLGTRMSKAFRYGFTSGYHSIVIIGTDCLELTPSIIEDAFNKLKSCDTVIGPAKDGGYYLLGMKALHEDLFKNKLWSSPSVYEKTVGDFKSLSLNYEALPVLSDIDEATDIPFDLAEII